MQIVDAQDVKVEEQISLPRFWMAWFSYWSFHMLQTALPYCKRLARHFEAAKQFAEAEKFFVRAKLANEAVEMYIRANKWDDVLKVFLISCRIFPHLWSSPL